MIMNTTRILWFSLMLLAISGCGSKDFGITSATRQSFRGGAAGSKGMVQYTLTLRAGKDWDARVMRVWVGNQSEGYFASFGINGLQDQNAKANILKAGSGEYQLLITENLTAAPDPRNPGSPGIPGPTLIQCPATLPAPLDTQKGLAVFFEIQGRDSIIAVSEFEELEPGKLE